jgi:hypothetical protein
MKKSLVLVALLIGTPAMAWDPVGDVTSGKVFSNVAREGGKIIDRVRQTSVMDSIGLIRGLPRLVGILTVGALSFSLRCLRDRR